MRSREVIYLTGPPAAGKTTLVERLGREHPTLVTLVYSQLLTKHVEKSLKCSMSQSKLRRESAKLITPETIAEVDRQLIAQVQSSRRKSDVIIDSHPLTKEDFGFRMTAFSRSFLHRLRPTMICMLFTSPKSVKQRIRNNADGRPQVTPFEANFHCFGQASIAIAYGLELGVPVYFYDTSVSIDKAFRQLAKRLT